MRRQRFYSRRTKIVCTIGPATDAAGVPEQLIAAGMDIARLNLAHGTHDEHKRRIGTIKRASESLGIKVAILVDLPGPKYRIGKLSGGQVTLKRGAQVVLTTRQIEGDATILPVTLPNLAQDIDVGDTILLDDGALQLKALEKGGGEVRCRVTVGGALVEGRGLVVPGMRTSGPFVTDSLRQHIRFAIKQQPDYVALSFIRTSSDVASVRAILGESKAEIPIIAKIERGEALRNFDSILAVTDGIMVARGDLGVDIPLERVPLAQKELIRKCNQAGKPVITATEMLESMIDSVRPTRAETTDVANAIFDGTDATMLSAETAIGKYPVQAVRMMAKIAREAENKLPYDQMLAERSKWLELKTSELISYNACHTAHALKAAAIVAFTQSGSTAGRLSKYRPRAPILAITPSSAVSGRLVLRWGVHPFQIAGMTSVEELFPTGARLARDLGLARPGDLVVITGGIPLGEPGSTNLLKVQKVD
ncbi:MAG: pyruvate kinase [Chloroflexi bacterium]|nr:pyruvate kinase [Chloroflexota bacterium]